MALPGHIIDLVHEALAARFGDDARSTLRVVALRRRDDGHDEEAVHGFMGEHIRLVAECEAVEEEPCQVELFVKTLPYGEVAKMAIHEALATFDKETLLYGTLFARFAEALDCPQWHPKCYAADGKSLIFEDLTVIGYRMHSSQHAWDTNHCKVALTSIAAFHASCIVYEAKESCRKGYEYRLGSEYERYFSERILGYCAWLKTCIETVEDIAETRGKGKRGIRDAFKRILALVEHSDKHRETVVHMDLWNNNLMFKYDNANATPMQCAIVDFQAGMLRPPVLDVVSALRLNMDAKTLNENADELLRHYHAEFASNLTRGGVNPDGVHTWDEFRASYEEYKPWGVAHCLILYPFTFLSAARASAPFDGVVNESRAVPLLESLEEDEVLKGRFNEVFDEFLETYVNV